MKFSSLAFALTTAPIVGTAAQRGTTTRYKKMIRGADLPTTTAVERERPALSLVNVNTDDDSEILKNCMSLSTSGQSGCNADESCSWCLSGAVPSACYPTSMTAQLPAGVFQCDKGTNAKVAGTPFPKKAQTFNLKESITLTLSSAEVDKNFCDASSPLSLAGYMNGELHGRSAFFVFSAVF